MKDVREFHDATIDVFAKIGNDVVLDMEDVSVYADASIPEGTHESGRFTISGVKRILENDAEVNSPTRPFSYGRILDLTVTDEVVVLFVEWQYTEAPVTQYAEYKIYGEGTNWSPSASFPPE